MTIQSIPDNDRVERLVASAGQTVFTYDFPIYNPADLEVRRFRGVVETLLQRGPDYAVAGAEQQGGGTITLAAGAQAGDLIVIRSAQPIVRQTRFSDGGDLPAGSVNAEFNRLFIALQQLLAANRQAIRLPVADPQQAAELPAAGSRANTVVGFGGIGELQLVPRNSIGGAGFQQTGTGSVLRAAQDELALIIHPLQFGAAGDGVADDTAALQLAMNEAAARGAFLDVQPGTYRTTDTVTLPQTAAGMHMRGRILYAGPAGRPALVIGAPTIRSQSKRYTGLRVERETLASWTDEEDVGIRLLNLDACMVEVLRVERFTIGVQTVGSGIAGSAAGFEDTNIHLGRLVDCRYGLDVRATQPGPDAWNNSVRYFGGHFANSSGTHPTLSRFGVRLSAAPGAYDLHNQHTFFGPAFELQRQGTPGTVDAIPFLAEVSGRALVAHDVRMEGCSPFVARHTAAFNDATYRVGYVGTYGFLGCAVDYPPSATRAGGTVLPMHQAGAAQGAPRLLAGAGNVRSLAFRDVTVAAGGVGFEGMALASSNPSGGPTTLNTLLFGGLALLTLNADDVTVPTSRALGYVLDLRGALRSAGHPAEIFIGAEGAELRPVVMQFDASENVLGNAAPVLFSNGNTVWGGTPSYWWELNVDLDTLTGGLPLNALQRVRLHPSAAFAFIGIRGGSASAVLRSLRLFAGAELLPRVLAGAGRAWGRRELATSQSWTVPSLAPGATTTLDVTLPGVRQGDLVTAGHAKDSGFQNGGVVFHAVVGGTNSVNQVRVTAQNVSAGTIIVGDGTLFLRAVRPSI